MHSSLSQLAHRPWPIPASAWTWRQNWYDLLFAHWPIPASEVRRLVPEELTVQEFNGTSWVGVVPFRMTGVMRRPFPDLPWVSAFPELNLRFYVERDGMPGVWFASLDATNALAVWSARRFFHLPYHHARIDFQPDAATAGFRFRSTRARGEPPVTFEAAYHPISDPFLAEKGSLEAFLTERYCLYSRSPTGRLYRAHVHHVPWPLQLAHATIDAAQLVRPHGLTLDGPPALTHFSRGVDVVVWSLERLT